MNRQLVIIIIVAGVKNMLVDENVYYSEQVLKEYPMKMDNEYFFIPGLTQLKSFDRIYLMRDM